MKNKVYIYPITARFDNQIANPYINDLIRSLEHHYICVNKNNPSNIGIFNLYKFFFKSDIFHLNWIEELPDKKLGTLQVLFFIFILMLTRPLGKKVIWTLHNKTSHQQKNLQIKRLLQRILSKKSDYIITHSQEGILYYHSLTTKNQNTQIRYIPHPIKEKFLSPVKEFKYDIIIWGNILKYKGIHLFLKFLKNKGAIEKYNILIAGKFYDPSYKKELLNYKSRTITIIDEYIEKSKLQEYMQHTKIILFTYVGKYVLSSGALMDSLAYGNPVIGPDVGAFSDLKEEGLIYTYQNFTNLIQIIDKVLALEVIPNQKRLQNFIQENSWEKYGSKLHGWITETTT